MIVAVPHIGEPVFTVFSGGIDDGDGYHGPPVTVSHEFAFALDAQKSTPLHSPRHTALNINLVMIDKGREAHAELSIRC